MEDSLRHLKDMGSMCKLHGHDVIKLGAVDREVPGELMRMKARLLPLGPAKVVPNILRPLYGVTERRKGGRPPPKGTAR